MSEGYKTQTQKYKVKLLFPDGDKPEVVEEIEVPVFFNPDFGEEEITPEGRELIEQTKAKFLNNFRTKKKDRVTHQPRTPH